MICDGGVWERTDPDAQDCGSEKRDLLTRAGRNQSQYQARGHNTAVRGNAEAKS